MRKVIPAVLLALFFIVGIPLVLGLFAGQEESKPEEDVFSGKVDTPETVSVWISGEGKAEEIDFEEYVACVTASEMPSTFDEEALKAQSVAARTYAMAKILKYGEKRPESHPDAPLCDTTHCQAYKSEDKLIEIHEDGWEESGFKKVRKACEATEGELLYYDGELVTQPLFFSSSGGQTENSEDVFTGAYPYLVSVSSPYEENASHQNEEKEFSFEEIKTLLAKAYPDRTLGSVSASSIEIISRTDGGRVEKMQVGEASFKGTEIRNALGLSSSLFSISFSGDGSRIIFTSDGFGHGVGLSQYGADGMAKEGSGYKEILSHYYTGTEVH
ncbi:MAG: stage II sporulation protein D [Anaerovoracaceae bacterium]